MVVALAAVGTLAIAAALLRPRLERAVTDRLLREAARLGLSVQIQAVRVGPGLGLELRGLRLARPGLWTLLTERAVLSLRPWAGGGLCGARLALDPVRVTGPTEVALQAAPTVWDVTCVSPDGVRAELRQPRPGLVVTWRRTADGHQLDVQAVEAPAGEVLAVLREGRPLLDGGVVGGTARLTSASGSMAFEADLAGRGARLASLSADPLGGEAPLFGQPTDVALRVGGTWRSSAGVLDLRSWRVAAGGATVSGSLVLADVPRDPALDLSLQVERVDFARLFQTSGLDEPPGSVLGLPATLGEGALGSASLTARVRGRLRSGSSFAVSQRLEFTPPPRLPAALLALRGEFAHEVAPPGGARRTILVSPASPDFIALRDVPALFVRGLLLSEDAGFFGHRGIDLSELPAAVLDNWNRGGVFRGASTLTQQLAKNLFLSREKRLGRKLQELCLALLLEATLGKERILEIYLNVIEWGPGLYGLRPAAHRYFHREPGELTPKQTAFLIALVPGPLKYQRSFASGTLSRGFRPLVDDVVAKLCSTGALLDRQCQEARGEELWVDAAPGAALRDPASP